MPTYFFDINDGERQDCDDMGQELPDLNVAREAAIGVLPDIARDVLPDGNRRDFVASVRTEHDGVVFKGACRKLPVLTFR